jgi:hypothetical protein
MEQILYAIMPAFILGWYLKNKWDIVRKSKIMLGLLIAGTLIFYAGIFTNPILGSTLKLLGTCLFFTVVAVNLSRASKDKPGINDQNLNEDEDSEYN